MSTKNEIIKIGDALIREKGFNAFSFNYIAKILRIKTSSVNYYFSTKKDLGFAVFEEQIHNLELLIQAAHDKEKFEKLQEFFYLYTFNWQEAKVCLVGSFATDLKNIDIKLKNVLQTLVDKIIFWLGYSFT